MAKVPDIDVPAIRKRLVMRRNEVEQLIANDGDDRRPVELDQQAVGRLSRMDAMQVQAMAEETHRRREAEIKRIDAALQRIADDEYGWCTSCGEEIALKRLENDPATPLCIDCAGRAS